MSNLGKWDAWYSGLKAAEQPRPYSKSPAYLLGATFLKDCKLVEDWGCGLGWMRTLIPPERYRGIDGSASPFADAVVDLAEYHSTVDGIFIRGVIEHDLRWAMILSNACRSFTKRMCLVIYTPMLSREEDSPKVISHEPTLGVPDISFGMKDLMPFLAPLTHWRWEDVEAESQFGQERVFYLEK